MTTEAAQTRGPKSPARARKTKRREGGREGEGETIQHLYVHFMCARAHSLTHPNTCPLPPT